MLSGPILVAVLADAFRSLPPDHQAQAALIADESVDHEYLSITGLAEFTSSAAKLILGRDSLAISENRVASVQTISGTGANHLGGVFLSKFYDYTKYAGLVEKKQIFISNPTWANHKAIFNSVGIEPVDYPYVSVSALGEDVRRQGQLSHLLTCMYALPSNPFSRSTMPRLSASTTTASRMP